MPYSLDTSYLLDAWAVWHPLDIFDGYWEVLLGAAKAGEVFVVDAVRGELERQMPDLVALFDQKAPGWTRPTSDDLGIRSDLNALERDLNRGELIRGTYPRQNIKKYMAVADPILILHARRNDHVVVSKELSDLNCKKGPKIPDLCRHFNVSHASPNEFARVLGYTYSSKRQPE
jgi:hypothetical protein